jgi:DNA primase
LLKVVMEHYHETLKQSPEAQQYLIQRGLQSAEMVERFRLGFANRTLGYHLPASNRLAGEEQRTRLKQLGILKNQTPGHEHFRGSLVIPILNLDGEVMQMYGRKITRASALRDGTPVHLYLPGPHRGVWNEQALMVSKEIILCEALIDALTFWCAGFRHVTTIYGVNGFTDELRAALKYHGTKRIYIAYDADEAGHAATEKHAPEIMEMGIECFRVQFPKGQDANEYARMTQPAAKALGLMLNSSTWLGKGKRPAVTVTASTATAQPVEEPAKTAANETSSTAEVSANASQESLFAASSSQPAAKEKNISAEPGPVPAGEAAQQKSAPPLCAERIFLLAADSEAVPRQDKAAAEVETLPSSVRLSETAAPYMQVEIKDEEIVLTEGHRRYRVRGLEKNMSYELLRVNLLVSHVSGADGFHVDTIDLYSARQHLWPHRSQ